MNNRIKEIIESAFNGLENDPVLISKHEDLQKFAELIIAHTTGCVRDVLRDENSDLNYDASSQVQKRIKEHFGIEG